MREPTASPLAILAPFVKPDSLEVVDGIAVAEITVKDAAYEANAFYFGQTEWMKGWLQHVHRYPEFRERWHAVAGRWDGKIVVDLGCGPGNLLKSLGDHPALAIGVDVARGSLELAAEVGYVPLLADAHRLPFVDRFADLVALNATVHHCTEMETVILEAARLVRPGGVLVIDHDPQRSAWDYKGLGLALWQARKPIYRWMNRGGHRAEGNEQEWAEKTEVHHRPGHGLTESMLRLPLEALDFDVAIYPHNHKIGAGVLRGETGRSPAKLRWGQRLSGIDPDSRAGALSLMCVAVRR